jgi:hypothetical protein
MEQTSDNGQTGTFNETVMGPDGPIKIPRKVHKPSYKTEWEKMTESRNFWRKFAFVELGGIVFLVLVMIAIVLIQKS